MVDDWLELDPGLARDVLIQLRMRAARAPTLYRGARREIQAALHTEQLAAPAALSAAFIATTRATVAIIGELNRQIAELEASLAEHLRYTRTLTSTSPARTRCGARRPVLRRQSRYEARNSGLVAGLVDLEAELAGTLLPLLGRDRFDRPQVNRSLAALAATGTRAA